MGSKALQWPPLTKKNIAEGYQLACFDQHLQSPETWADHIRQVVLNVADHGMLSENSRGMGRVQASRRASDITLEAFTPGSTLIHDVEEYVESMLQNLTPDDRKPFAILGAEDQNVRESLWLSEKRLRPCERLQELQPGLSSTLPYLSLNASLSCTPIQKVDADLECHNLLWTGEPRMWVIIHSYHSSKVETLLARMVGAKRHSCSMFAQHTGMRLSPSTLRESSIDFSVVVQEPGTALRTLPGVYHYILASGPGMMESVYACDPEWRPSLSFKHCSLKVCGTDSGFSAPDLGTNQPCPNKRARTRTAQSIAAVKGVQKKNNGPQATETVTQHLTLSNIGKKLASVRAEPQDPKQPSEHRIMRTTSIRKDYLPNSNSERESTLLLLGEEPQDTSPESTLDGSSTTDSGNEETSSLDERESTGSPSEDGTEEVGVEPAQVFDTREQDLVPEDDYGEDPPATSSTGGDDLRPSEGMTQDPVPEDGEDLFHKDPSCHRPYTVPMSRVYNSVEEDDMSLSEDDEFTKMISAMANGRSYADATDDQALPEVPALSDEPALPDYPDCPAASEVPDSPDFTDSPRNHVPALKPKVTLKLTRSVPVTQSQARPDSTLDSRERDRIEQMAQCITSGEGLRQLVEASERLRASSGSTDDDEERVQNDVQAAVRLWHRANKSEAKGVLQQRLSSWLIAKRYHEFHEQHKQEQQLRSTRKRKRQAAGTVGVGERLASQALNSLLGESLGYEQAATLGEDGTKRVKRRLRGLRDHGQDLLAFSLKPGLYDPSCPFWLLIPLIDVPSFEVEPQMYFRLKADDRHLLSQRIQSLQPQLRDTLIKADVNIEQLARGDWSSLERLSKSLQAVWV